jgi:NodT family efflux transporter outer membrane factor (OMF) lipoprotein
MAEIDSQICSEQRRSKHPSTESFSSKRIPAGRIFVLTMIGSLGLALGGCGLDQWWHNGLKVGPDYHPTTAPVASNWIDYKDSRVASQDQDLSRWWTVFGDPVLDDLEREAAEENLSLKVAGTRIAEARAVRGIAVGNLFPQVQELNGSYSANKASTQAPIAPSQQWYQNWEAGFNMNWELDLWGRFRRSVEAADAELEASIHNYDDVRVLLLADVAANYVQYRTFQVRLDLARKNVQIQEGSYQLAKDKFDAGASTERDMQQARQVLEQTRSLIPQFEFGQRQANNALCVLLGIPAQDLSMRLGPAQAIPSTPADVVIGIPADLVRRRPDVRRAERETAAQSARIGVATADLYPRFSVFGTLGVQSENFGDLFKTPGSLFGSIGPSFNWAILNYGRIENRIHFEEAHYEGLMYTYKQAVLDAARQAEDSLTGFLKSQEQARDLGASVTAAERTLTITYDQYKDGAVDFTAVFLFEGILTSQQDQLAVANGQIALQLIDLYRSLGGGWEVPSETSTAGPATNPSAAMK